MFSTQQNNSDSAVRIHIRVPCSEPARRAATSHLKPPICIPASPYVRYGISHQPGKGSKQHTVETHYCSWRVRTIQRSLTKPSSYQERIIWVCSHHGDSWFEYWQTDWKGSAWSKSLYDEFSEKCNRYTTQASKMLDCFPVRRVCECGYTSPRRNTKNRSLHSSLVLEWLFCHSSKWPRLLLWYAWQRPRGNFGDRSYAAHLTSVLCMRMHVAYLMCFSFEWKCEAKEFGCDINWSGFPICEERLYRITYVLHFI